VEHNDSSLIKSRLLKDKKKGLATGGKEKKSRRSQRTSEVKRFLEAGEMRMWGG